ncbi:MAG: hypothetical protein ABEK17_01570 [Candidatus Aenigmatarchaeota archaeon]
MSNDQMCPHREEYRVMSLFSKVSICSITGKKCSYLEKGKCFKD